MVPGLVQLFRTARARSKTITDRASFRAEKIHTLVEAHGRCRLSLSGCQRSRARVHLEVGKIGPTAKHALHHALQRFCGYGTVLRLQTVEAILWAYQSPKLPPNAFQC